MKQTQRIINYCKEHGSISAAEAERLGCHRLAARISDIKKEGYIVTTKKESSTNQYGGTSWFARYSIREPEGR